MSLYGAMLTGVAGLDAFSNSLSVASANIANVNTVGYKTAESNFSTLLASAGSNTDPSTAGVISSSGQNVVQQGLLQTTASPTDLAVSGNGFFVVSASPGDLSTRLYTRAGNFTTDSSGLLRNAGGFYLLGWQLDSSGNLPSDRNDMTTINVNSLAGKATATTTMSIQANLQSSTAAYSGASTYNPYATPPVDMANGAVPANFQRTINVYDSQGGAQPVQISFVKTGANTWNYEVSYQGNPANLSTGMALLPAADGGTGTVTFNTDGTLASVTPTGSGAPAATKPGSISITLPFSASSGLQQQTVSIDMGTIGASDGITQFDNPSTMVSSKVDGALFGSLSGVSVDNQGYVTAQFTNGLSQKVYKIPLATFANANGLSEISGNAYSASANSGTPTITEADLGGAGTIASKNLEGSTVDLASEFTNLITTQRAYSACSRIVSTASQMLDQLLQMSH